VSKEAASCTFRGSSNKYGFGICTNEGRDPADLHVHPGEA